MCCGVRHVRDTLACMQELLHGPHTMVRVDHAAASAPTSALSPGRKAGRSGGRQTGLGSFYKSALLLPRPHEVASHMALHICCSRHRCT